MQIAAGRSNQFDTTPTSPAPLDGPPPHAAPRPAGADTNSLLGQQPDSSMGGLALNPKARVIAAIAMGMQMVNLIQSTVPGYQPIAIIAQLVDQMSKELPEAVDQLTKIPNPMTMLSAVGSALGPGGGAGAPSLGAPVPTNPAVSAGVPAGSF